MRKRILFGLLAMVMVVGIFAGLTACDKKDEKLICGVTIYEPMNYKENGEWTGFDTDLAKLVGEKLGMTVEFQEIKWESKYSELAAGTISCIWNGFTANSVEEDGRKRSEYVDFSYSYMLNQQCIVIKSENTDKFKKAEDLLGKSAAAEKGSAGESAAKEIIGDTGKMVDSPAQINTFTEVKSGAVDCAVVDILLAQKMTGGGNYSDLSIADIELESEVYAIGFKKGSDLTQKVNTAIKELNEAGKLEELAIKYKIENRLKLDTNFKG